MNADEIELHELMEDLKVEKLQATIEALQQAMVSDEGDDNEPLWENLWENKLVDDDSNVLTVKECEELNNLVNYCG